MFNKLLKKSLLRSANDHTHEAALSSLKRERIKFWRSGNASPQWALLSVLTKHRRLKRWFLKTLCNSMWVMNSVPPKTMSRFGKQGCGQEDPWAKGCICLPHSIGITYHCQHRINFPTVSRTHLSAVFHTHPSGRENSWAAPFTTRQLAPGSWPPTCQWHGHQEPAQPALPLNILSSPSLVFCHPPVVNCSSWDMASTPVTCQPHKSMASAAGETWSCKNLRAFQRSRHRRLEPHDVWDSL